MSLLNVEYLPLVSKSTGYSVTIGTGTKLSGTAVGQSPLILVSKPRVNLTRFHGVFAPNSKHRIDVTPAKRGKGRAKQEDKEKHRNSVTSL
jgi:hypothetical protein